MILRIFFSIQFITNITVLCSIADFTEEWSVIEALAEENPYVVALLNGTLDYKCSGATIGRRTVLTSGYCITLRPTFVAVGLALLSKKLSNMFVVSHTLLHVDFTSVMNVSKPSATKMHSNIGLVFVTRPVLDLFLPPATIGSYFATELNEVELTTVGYGRRRVDEIDTETFELQYQCYDQSTCINPRWYYCLCGTEIASAERTHGKDFGNGAPVMFGSVIVCISAISTETLVLRSTDVKFSIFTIIGPYIPWIEKSETSTKEEKIQESSQMRIKSEAHLFNHCRVLRLVFVVHIFLLIS